MKFSVRFFSSLYISLLCAGVSSSVLASQAERWFEIEVILFNQLNDKKLLKEQFPDNISSTNLPQYKKHVDLLTPYLQPDLSAIKQFMPWCSEKDAQHVFLESLQKVNTPFLNAIKAIEHVEGFNMPKFTSDNKAIGQPEYKATDVRPSNSELASPLFSTQNLCIISRKDIEPLFSDEQVTNFQLDAFAVAALPSKLNASGAHISDSPYLIANESLQLADIKQRLRWSKEFKPLLHFGWRQVAVTRKKAIPIKLFAGEHLDYQYQHALDDYQSALNEAKLAEQLITQQLTLAGQQEIDKTTLPAEHNKNNDAAIKQQQLTQLFTDIKGIESANINNIIAKLERQTFGELIAIDNVSMDENKRLKVNSPPVKPLQPWFLDGFFKVHLDHYLYITADFNLVNQSLNKNSNNDTDSAQVKLINFNQKKRVITGEIHYFDHPYIGMIVQIRRFDPSKPKEEAVTQVIN